MQLLTEREMPYAHNSPERANALPAIAAVPSVVSRFGYSDPQDEINTPGRRQVTLPITHVEEHLAAWTCIFIKVWKCAISGAVSHYTDWVSRGLEDGRVKTHHAGPATQNYRTSTTDCHL